MTIRLQIGHTYRTRDGSAEHTIAEIDSRGVAYTVNRGSAWWSDTGNQTRSFEYPTDLVEDVTPPTAPVRQTTVTRTEIVPGIYGRLQITHGGTFGELWVRVVPRNPLADVDYAALTAEELDALAATATQLANALRAIAAEKGTDQ